MINGSVFQEMARFSPNLLNYFSSLQILTTLTKVSGSAGSGVSFDTDYHYFGTQCIKSYNDTDDTPLVWNMGTVLSTQLSPPSNDGFWVVMPILQRQNVLQYAAHTFQVDVTLNGSPAVADNQILFTLPLEENGEVQMVRERWYLFAALVQNLSGSVDFQFTHTTDPTTTEGNSTLWVGGIGLFANDRLLGLPPVFMPPKNMFVDDLTLDFGSTLSGATTDITGLPLFGAREKDVMTLTPPPSIMAQGGEYTAFVTSNDTWTARFYNNTASTINPNSGLFTARLTK